MEMSSLKMFSVLAFIFFHKVILYYNSYVPLDISPANRARCPAFKTSSSVTAQQTDDGSDEDATYAGCTNTLECLAKAGAGRLY